MKRRAKPTNAELAILRVLWSRGPSTVREVADAMGWRGAYTTVLKQMQVMLGKRLVHRNASERSHRYEATRSEDQMRTQMVGDLLDRLFDGSASKLVLNALAAANPTPEELAEIRALIDAHRGGRK